jgi:hypothetical protein
LFYQVADFGSGYKSSSDHSRKASADQMIDLPCPSILLHPTIPLPLHGLNPRTMKGKSWWDGVRQIAYATNDFRCWACNVHKSKAKYHRWLEAHEAYKIDYLKGRMELDLIVALCHSCHNFIHKGRLSILQDSGKITEEKFLDIITHGVSVLEEAGLSLLRPFDELEHVSWEDWRFVLDGEEFAPLFATQKDWEEHYGS